VAHHADHFGADRLAVELDRFFAAAVEEQIGLDLHASPIKAEGSSRSGVASCPGIWLYMDDE